VARETPASDVMEALEYVNKITPSRLRSTVICGFYFIKRNLRWSIAVAHSKLFPSLCGLETAICTNNIQRSLADAIYANVSAMTAVPL